MRAWKDREKAGKELGGDENNDPQAASRKRGGTWRRGAEGRGSVTLP